MIWFFYVFIFLLLLQTLISLRGGRDYLAYFRRELDARRPNYAPFATIFAPCRGLDQGLSENLAALLRLDYPRYEVVFITDSANDACVAVIEQARREFPDTPSQLIIAGAARDCGQKVHNLREAIPRADTASEVFVFADSDARPHAAWLRALVAPLAEENIGASSGYRWFTPTRGGLASRLRAVWNASVASALGANGRRNFCWGGATAIRRKTFERLEMSEKWRGALSDDFALTRALHEAGLDIHFAPQCLTASLEDCGWRELFEFTTRQIKITRVYAANLWVIVLVSNLLFTLTFFGGWLLAARRVWLVAPLLLLYALGSLKALMRWQAVKLALDGKPGRGLWAHLLLWPVTSAIYAYNAICAAFSRRIVWRGIVYEMKSPTETVIKSN
jgi:cellulose synthase/poly-beta-1,6-N-acetylglucosamine synthase-like glycosyltransferase